MLKRIIGCVREYKKETLLSPIFISLEVITECIMPFVTAKLITQIENGCSLGVIAKYGGFLLLIAFSALLFGVLSGRYSAIASCGFAKNLRRDLFYAVQDYSFTNIDNISSSSLVTRLTTDVTNVQHAFMMVIRVALRSPLMLIISFTMAVFINPKMSLLFAVSIPVLGAGLFGIMRGAMPIFKKVFKKYDKLNNSIQENVSGMRVVKAYVRENFETQKFSNASQDVRDDFTRAEKILALNGPLMQLIIHTIITLMCIIGAKLIVNTNATSLTIGDLSSLLVYGAQIFTSLMMVSMIFVMISMALESAKRINEVLEEKSTITNPENPLFEVADGSIEFDNVSFKYSKESEKFALKNINLKINSGETVGIIGGTGSAKTTLIQLISRLYDANEGSVYVGGKDVKEYDIKTLRDKVSVVLQKNVLFSGTIKENLRWGDKNATDEQIQNACKFAQADEFIQSFPDKYDTFIEQGGTNVSGGQKQRLCIARAMLKKPKILILDDSTSAVDTKTDALIQKALKTEFSATTKIIIAQRISSVQDADKIIVMENGTIDAIGTHDELLKTNSIYNEVYTSQNKAGGKNE